MTTGALVRLLDDAARGVFPPPDGEVDVVPAPNGIPAAVFTFTAHMVVAADVDPSEVHRIAPTGDFSAWSRVGAWLAHQRGLHAFSGDVMLAALADGGAPLLELELLDKLDHPRVARAAHFRDDLRVYATRDRNGVLVLGRGVAGRHEIAFEVEPAVRGAGLGRALARSALALVPAGEAMWAQVHPGNVASLRPVLAAGFQPVGYEQLVGHD
jgi:hypothetical protein